MGATLRVRLPVLLGVALGTVGYLLLAERLFGSLAVLHVVLIPFGNVWAGAAFFLALAFAAMRLWNRRAAGTASAGDYVLLSLLLLPWVAYVSLGIFMHRTGGL
jgi:hypothetical protein